MTDDPEALRRLEERVAALETELRELRARAWLGAGPRAVPARPVTNVLPPRSPAPGVAPVPAPATDRPPASRPTLTPLPATARTTDFEQWFGQRGLLLVGVVALIAAGGFFLKYAFDHGWIAPWLRVLGALAAGTGVALLGERQIARDLKRYGAGLIGAGAGLAYLGLWAAAGPYDLVPRDLGPPLLAALTAVVAWRAAVHQQQVLAGFAVAGAFFAPVFLPAPEPQLVLFLAYLEIISVAAALLAARMRWIGVFGVVLFGYFILPVALAGAHLNAPAAYVHGVLGGVGAIALTVRRGWPELSVAGILGAWMFLAVAIAQDLRDPSLLPLASATALVLAAWMHDRRTALAGLRRLDLGRVATVDTVAFLASPLAFAAIASVAVPDALRPYSGLPVALLAMMYGAAGWKPRSAPFMAMAAALLLIAVAQAWDGSTVTVLWMALAFACIAVDRRFVQDGLRPMGVGLAWLAGAHQMIGLAALPAESTTAFTEPWARTLFMCVAGSAAAAMAWRPIDGEHRDDAGPVHPDALWALSALLLFAGVSVMIRRYFGAQQHEWAGALLAGRLALSVWWLVYAAAAVQIGFALNVKGVRTVGLVVAGVAALKIGLYDLANLEALYRVGAFFGLALVALAVAYLYSRRARAVGGG